MFGKLHVQCLCVLVSGSGPRTIIAGRRLGDQTYRKCITVLPEGDLSSTVNIDTCSTS